MILGTTIRFGADVNVASTDWRGFIGLFRLAVALIRSFDLRLDETFFLTACQPVIISSD